MTTATLLRGYTTAIFAILIYEAPASGSTAAGEFCHGESFTASCSIDEVVVMRSAFYGRMRTGRCVKPGYTQVGCRANVLRQADRICSGRRSCRIQVIGRSFGNVQPCPTEAAKSYFEVSYECKKVLTVMSPECNVHKVLTIRNRFGLLSNLVAEERGQGSLACPWRIELPRGERINLTLVDFSTPNADVASESQTCHQYALVTEKLSTTENGRVCGGDRREKHVYTSRTNTIEIRIITKKNVETDRNFYFLLRYEAIGCSVLDPPRNGWMLRDTDGVLMGCNHTAKTWRLNCDGNKWNGQMENCSTNERYDKSTMVWKHVTVPQSVVLAVIGSLVIITVIIIALLSLLCIEWRKGKTQPRMRHLSSPSSREPPLSTPSSGAKITHQSHHHNSRHSHHYQSSSTRTRYDPLKAPDCDRAPPVPPPHGPGRSSVGAAAAAAGALRGEADYYATVSEDREASSSPRASPSSYDYLREMWPMALPPGNVAGTTSTALYKDAEVTDTSPFQYGDSVTMTTSPVRVHSSRPAPEYDTHIYETPKYLRREKAATLRLKGAKAQSKDADPAGLPGSAAAVWESAGAAKAVHSRTLPRDLSLNNNSRRS